MLVLLGSHNIAKAPIGINQCIVFGYEDLEALEEAPSLGSLGTDIANENIRACPDVPKTLEQGRVEGKGDRPTGSLQRA